MPRRTVRAPRFTVTVTPELIEHSKTRDSSHCMIAEAVKQAYPGAAFVSVDLQTIRFSDPGKGERYTYLTPRISQVALINFDQGHAPEPFQFQLRNGQVTRAGDRHRAHPLQQLSPEEKAARADHLLSQRLVHQPGGEQVGAVPDRIGGRTPPTTPFARRRAFGLRALVK